MFEKFFRKKEKTQTIKVEVDPELYALYSWYAENAEEKTLEQLILDDLKMNVTSVVMPMYYDMLYSYKKDDQITVPEHLRPIIKRLCER